MKFTVEHLLFLALLFTAATAKFRFDPTTVPPSHSLVRLLLLTVSGYDRSLERLSYFRIFNRLFQ